MPTKGSSEKPARVMLRKTRRKFSTEAKIRIVPEDLLGAESIASTQKSCDQYEACSFQHVRLQFPYQPNKLSPSARSGISEVHLAPSRLLILLGFLDFTSISNTTCPQASSHRGILSHSVR